MAVALETVLLLGGNLGDLLATFVKAEALINERLGTVLARSRDHWTEPWGFTDERLFLNRALLVRSDLNPTALLEGVLRIERELGRIRDPAVRYSARTIDIDILLIGDRVIDLPQLQVPHPRMHERAFALSPAADITPNWVHPLLHRTVLKLLNDLRHPVPAQGRDDSRG